MVWGLFLVKVMFSAWGLNCLMELTDGCEWLLGLVWLLNCWLECSCIWKALFIHRLVVTQWVTYVYVLLQGLAQCAIRNLSAILYRTDHTAQLILRRRDCSVRPQISLLTQCGLALQFILFFFSCATIQWFLETEVHFEIFHSRVFFIWFVFSPLIWFILVHIFHLLNHLCGICTWLLNRYWHPLIWHSLIFGFHHHGLLCLVLLFVLIVYHVQDIISIHLVHFAQSLWTLAHYFLFVYIYALANDLIQTALFFRFCCTSISLVLDEDAVVMLLGRFVEPVSLHFSRRLLLIFSWAALLVHDPQMVCQVWASKTLLGKNCMS